MKTPKRYICPVKDVPCGREKPCFSWAERGYADRNDCARWKRKNREKQLKRTIARLKEQVEFQTKRAESLREMYIGALNRNTFLEMKLELDIRHNKKR